MSNEISRNVSDSKGLILRDGQDGCAVTAFVAAW